MVQKKSFKTILISLLMVGAFVGMGYGFSTALKPANSSAEQTAALSQTPMVPASFSDLAEKVRPGVVNIQVVKKVKNVGMEFRHFFGSPFGEKNPFEDFFGPFPGG